MISIKNSLKLILERILMLKTNKVNKTAIDNVYANKSLTITTNASGTKWTISTAAADLAGNVLRVVIAGTRSAGTAAGNITNEKVCTITIDSQGYIKGAYGTNSISSSDGGLAGFYTDNHTVSGNTVSFDLNMGATHQAITTTRTWFYVPVILNEDAFL